MAGMIIFDLDGTLIDSVKGIACSVNRTRQYYGFAPLPVEQITKYVGDGARKLLERACADVKLPVPLDEALQVMVRKYADDPVYGTTLYPGVAETLKNLRRHNWLLAVVSNKPQVVSDRILAGLGVRDLFCENIGGGAGFPLKPAPDACLYLMQKHQVDPGCCWMVGDNHTDMNSGAAAGMKRIFCTYGIGTRNGTESEAEVSDFAGVLSIVGIATEDEA